MIYKEGKLRYREVSYNTINIRKGLTNIRQISILSEPFIKPCVIDPSTRATALTRGTSLGMSPETHGGVVLPRTECRARHEVSERSESKDDASGAPGLPGAPQALS